MIDFARITVKAGDGGGGVGSFHQIKGRRYGKANGGDGGSGGDVYLEASGDLNTLEPYRFVKNYKAQNGQHGSSNLRRGANAGDLVLKVPMGTAVRVNSPSYAKASEGKQSRKSELELSTPDFDLVAEGDKLLIARGGQGGRGNAKLRDEFKRRPRAGEPGEVGENVNLVLELKLIADVGLIGLPNAGKSTLLAALTRAQPVIAPYPFTTLEPNLGVLKDSSLTTHSPREVPLCGTKWGHSPLILADIPGLIEGASSGRGLGHLFLRHIERTKILVHLIDISTSFDPWHDYQTIRDELKKYSKELAKKKEIIALNKIDLVDKNTVEKAKEEFKKHRKKAVLISAASSAGLDLLVKEMLRRLRVTNT